MTFNQSRKAKLIVLLKNEIYKLVMESNLEMYEE